ncbi:MAG: hypothetical protein ACLPXM_05335 [Terriglobales bacterium]
MQEKDNVFTCVRGGMELSPDMARRLYSCFVTRSEQPEEFEFTKESGYKCGGRWFCPGCGVVMREEVPGAVRCPECGRNIGKFLHPLVELHRLPEGQPPTLA